MSKFIEITEGKAGDPISSGHDLLTSAEYSIFDAVNNPTGTNTVSVSKIAITNNEVSGANQEISLYLYENSGDNTVFYLVKDLIIPYRVTWVWDEEFSFDITKHNLKLWNNGSSDANSKLTIIIS